jgi:deoxycytidylate deaminase
MSPCPECAKLIIQAKVARVVYREKYRLTAGIDMLVKYKIQVDQI